MTRDDDQSKKKGSIDTSGYLNTNGLAARQRATVQPCSRLSVHSGPVFLLKGPSSNQDPFVGNQFQVLNYQVSQPHPGAVIDREKKNRTTTHRGT